MLKPAKEICPTTTLGKVNEGVLMVDVRTKEEVNSVTFDVDNYLNIPYGELEERINEIPKNQEIIMVCNVGDKSLWATYYLMKAGYPTVYNMSGGINKWARKGFPLKGDVEKLNVDESCSTSGSCCS